MTIKQQQHILGYLGYDPGIPDGIYGKNTGDAVEDFQRDNGLTHDRVWGPMTEEKARYNFIHDIFRPVSDDKPEDVQLPPEEIDAAGSDADTSQDSDDFWAGIKYFTRDEFRCPCGKCGGFPVEPAKEIVLEADLLRDAMKKAVIIVPPDGHSGGSGIRCAEYNATLSGSAANSRHLLGRAVDFSAPGISDATISAYLERRKAAGKLHYWYRIQPGSFHMDV